MQVDKSILVIFLTFVVNSLFTIQALSLAEAAATSHEGDSKPGSYSLGLFLFLVLIVVVLLIRKGKKRERKLFSAEIKRGVLKKQKHKCAYCKWNPGVLDFDHRDGNRSNNRLSNCIALCPNCHAKKTRGVIVIKNKSGINHVWLIIILFIFLLLAAFIMSSWN